MTNILIAAAIGFILFSTFSLTAAAYQYDKAMRLHQSSILFPRPRINFPVAFFYAFVRGMIGVVVVGAIAILVRFIF